MTPAQTIYAVRAVMADGACITLLRFTRMEDAEQYARHVRQIAMLGVQQVTVASELVIGP